MTTEDHSPRRVPLSAVVAQAHNSPITEGRDGTAQRGRQLLDRVLGDLDELGVAIPAPVRRALTLQQEIADTLIRPPAVSAWLAEQDLDRVRAEDVAELMRAHVVAREVGDRRGELAREVTAHLVDRAVDALADHLDDVVDQLRPRWNEAARVVAAAVDAGITSATTADEAIADDTQVQHWRALAGAVATLDQLDAVYHRALFVTGYPLGRDEQARRGRATWLDASSGGPVELVAPTARPEPAEDTSLRPGDRRSGVAREVQREIITTQEERARTAEQQRTAGARLLAEQQHARHLAEDSDVLPEPRVDELPTIGVDR